MKIYSACFFRFVYPKPTVTVLWRAIAALDLTRSRVLATLALFLGFLTTPLWGQYVYITNNSDNTVSGYSNGTGGALSAVGNSPFATGQSPNGVAVDHTGQFVYVANAIDSTISG